VVLPVFASGVLASRYIVPEFVAICAKLPAVVCTFVELSLALCVVAVVPFGNAGVPLKPAAVPLVFAALFGMSALSSAGS
jgi:hypothetical protein